jgi:hypothetical protein
MKTTLTLIGLLFIALPFYSQVYVGDISLSTQEEVDNFSTNYPGITYVDGSLVIGTPEYNENYIDDISSLSSLSGAETLKIFNCTNFNNWVPSTIQNLTIEYAVIDPLDNSFLGLPSFTSNIANLDSLDISIYQNLDLSWDLAEVSAFSSLQNAYYVKINSGVHFTIENLVEVNQLIYYNYGGGRVELSSLSSLDTLITYGDANPQDYSTPYLPETSHINTILNYDLFCYDGLQGLSSLTSVGHLFISRAFNISGLSNLITAEVIDIRIEQLNGLYSLQNADKLDIEFAVGWNEPLVQDLAALNSLTTVDSLFISGSISGINGINFLQINDYMHLAGQDISFCSYPSICSFIANHGPEDYFLGENHAIGCSTVEEIEALCDPSNSYISGEIFFDINCDGVYDPGEFTISPGYAQLDTSGEIMYNVDQFLVLTEASSSVIISTANMLDYYAPINPIEITTAELGNLNPYLFIPVCAAYDFSDLQVSVLQSGNLSPGFGSDWNVQVTNQGTTTVDFIPNYTINTTEFVFSINPYWGNLNDYTITWEAVSINPGETVSFSFRITLLSTASLLGQTFSATANVTLVSGTDENLSNNTSLFEQEIIGSYDPNDKWVNTPQINIETIDPAQPLNLTYRVRFQNTGTAPAVNVRVEDILEEDLDPSTFELLETSHIVYYQIEGNEINFFFDNIILPDSTSDPEGSIGTFFFRIKSNGNHSLESSIDNQVSIFFDFNEPIITNVASTIFYVCPEVTLVYDDNILIATEGFASYQWTLDGNIIEGENENTITSAVPGNYVVTVTNEFGCSDESDVIEVVSSISENESNTIVLWPNPVKDVINISLEENLQNEVIQIFDAAGRIIYQNQINGKYIQIDMNPWPAGIYNLRIQNHLNSKIIKL